MQPASQPMGRSIPESVWDTLDHSVGWNGITVYCFWLPLWSSGLSSWLQIQGSGFDSQRYQIFWEVVGLERGPLSLVSTTEEVLGRESSGSGLQSRKYGRRDPWRWPSGTLYSQKLALTSPTRGGGSVDIALGLRPRSQLGNVLVLSCR
jgi:hypothetical protein